MRVVAYAIVLGGAACVPATAETDPRGAVVLRTEPSAASRGEPFTTSDGWTVTVETFVLQVSFGAETNDPAQPLQIGGGSAIFHGGRREDLVVTGVPAGPAVGLVNFSWSSVSDDGITSLPEDIRGVGLDVVQRFVLPPSGEVNDPLFVVGPGFVVVAHARKGERTLLFDVALRSSSDQHIAPVGIVANALVPATVPISIEALFTNEAGALVFDDVAVADTNGDGVLAPEELDQAEGTCTRCNPSRFGSGVLDSEKPSVLDMLQARSVGIIALPIAALSGGPEPDLSGMSVPLASGGQTRHASAPCLRR